ncbi:MAG: aminopeptidase [Gammaproteobacteria bacterium]|nr:aminopeptidase [Gammaproteobacteria bacterium]
MRLSRFLIIALLAGASAGCYYVHTVRGQLDVMSRREPIRAVIDDPSTPPGLKARLETVLDVREFASHELDLPDNDSYRSYADIGRAFVAWNVFAAPEFSVEPKEWCFPVVGCVTYRGYFDGDKAEAYAARLEDDGFDVYVGSVPAYSTLGHFDDPVLSTMLYWDDVYVASIIFHELAHQLLYVRDDAAFSEAFASVVGDAGVRHWLAAAGREDLLAEFEAARDREAAFASLVANGRERLHEIYVSGLPGEAMSEAKAQEFARVEEAYRLLVAGWDGFDAYGPWFDGGINNAKLVSVATYNDFAPAFRALLARCRDELPCFYARAEELAGLSLEERHERLRLLMAVSGNCSRPSA